MSHRHAHNMKSSHLIVTPARMNARRRDVRCPQVVRRCCPLLGCVLSESWGCVSFTADLSTAVDVSASTISGPIWKHMGGLSLMYCLQHALVTCYLAYATTTPTHVGLFHACPRDFRPKVINFPLDLNRSEVRRDRSDHPMNASTTVRIRAVTSCSSASSDELCKGHKLAL